MPVAPPRLRRVALHAALSSLLAAAALGCGARQSPRSAPGDAPPALSGGEAALLRSGEASQRMRVLVDERSEDLQVLRLKAAPLRPDDPLLDLLIQRMKVTLDEEKGVGVAAPQVGISRRLIWVQRKDLPDEPFRVYLNPIILERSTEQDIGWEGCLSIPAGFGEVPRARSIRLRHQSREGLYIEEEVEGYTARIFQHEIDHLDGLLFIDRRGGGEPLMPKDEYREMRRRERGGP